ncbi:hypothetical protein KIW84_031693 [Lathyrus oleraceus]|uniref:Reverse transcriptase Ty1/copia-type domain-containing protein n=1 Tax=Pisum sativum TaxID=3888 RepID=A0A9D5B165_PEA|nr:hypothetical protein KIW84_031693 [Pisum sativum]
MTWHPTATTFSNSAHNTPPATTSLHHASPNSLHNASPATSPVTPALSSPLTPLTSDPAEASTISPSSLPASISSVPSVQPSAPPLNSHPMLGKLDYFLGIEVTHLPNGSLHLSQTKYLTDLLSKTNMLNSNGMPTPMVSTSKLSRIGSNAVSDPTQFRSVVGALQYATLTRPEISFAVNKLIVEHVPAQDQWADALTKPLSAAKFLPLRDKFRVISKQQLSSTLPASTRE